ncbi:hypothetical protein C8R46DRAFT_1353343 [Mycena filopes]|nr:hypothetical protein C8R46DRAFT_1353343 [Mycena filopes]
MSVHFTWGTVLRTFDAANPGHLAVHADMMSRCPTKDTFILDYLVSPVRRVCRVPQLLQRILWAAEGVDPESDTPDILWAFGQVCSSWRRAALNDSMEITISLTDQWSRPLLQRLELRLQRSHPDPITVRVIGDVAATTHPALDILMKNSHRWEHASFEIPVGLLASLCAVKGRLQSLRKLDVILPHDARGLPFLDAFQQAPKLSAVHVTSKGGAVSLFLPWKQLEHFDAKLYNSPWLARSFVNINDQIFSESGMKNLVVCSIGPCLSSRGERWYPGEVRLPRLRELAISAGAQRAELDALLLTIDYFTAPALEILKVECATQNERIRLHVANLIRRSHCTLVCLVLKMPGEVVRFGKEEEPEKRGVRPLKDARIPSGATQRPSHADTARQPLHTLNLDAATLSSRARAPLHSSQSIPRAIQTRKPPPREAFV